MKPARRHVMAGIALIALSTGALSGVAGAVQKSDTQAGGMKKQCRAGTIEEPDNGWTCIGKDGKQQTCLERRNGGYDCWVTVVKPATGGRAFDHLVMARPGEMKAVAAP